MCVLGQFQLFLGSFKTELRNFESESFICPQKNLLGLGRKIIKILPHTYCLRTLPRKQKGHSTHHNSLQADDFLAILYNINLYILKVLGLMK